MKLACLALLLAADIGPPPPPPPAARIVFLEARRELCAINLREKDGARKGLRLDVYRGRRRVGSVEITEACVWGSWARPAGKTARGDLLRGDAVVPLP
jgi:hypothetical protein